MALITWNDALSVKVPEFDEQHKKLVAMLNELHDGMLKREAASVLGKVFGSLVDYTATHFAAEEARMKKANYPGLAAHKAEHDALTQKALDLKGRFESGTAAVTIETLEFLRTWLCNHIMKTDKAYGPYL